MFHVTNPGSLPAIPPYSLHGCKKLKHAKSEMFKNKFFSSFIWAIQDVTETQNTFLMSQLLCPEGLV